MRPSQGLPTHEGRPRPEGRRHRVERARPVEDLVGDEGLLDPDPVDRRLDEGRPVEVDDKLAGTQDDHDGGALEHG
ncbi:hypothetical protein L336_0061 [Candidatus Saccharimonas aalborgensis]|uniref:Uncharacterized protein n=1 Tax=Candidatus Saccharimonas aalborgensis TaxID=1332188 RepID=R4PVL0_9BACT|nr:hypothetical protein L336_0061 [Candidatus Saccharimonas aalborgensis]